MERYITEISKYIIAILMLAYAYESFAVFRFSDEESRLGIYGRQRILMLLIHFSCFMAICFETENATYLLFYVFQQLILFTTVLVFPMVYPKANRLLVNNMCMLLSISFVILTRLSFDKALKQFMIVVFSLIVAMVIPFFIHKLSFLKSLKWLYAGVGILLLSIVLILGNTTYGSKISYSIGGVTLQPSEFVKIIFVFFIAAALYQSTTIFEVFLSAVIAGAHVIVLVLSKDLGSALIFFVAYVLMVFVATKNLFYFIAGLLGGAFASVAAANIFSHVQVRIQAWQDPFSKIDSAGYQITQSLFAISSGGWFGLGLFQGTPASIPFVEADFIFSAIAEELGILFAMSVILVCVSCFIMFMNISVSIKDRFYQLIAFGLGIVYIFQVFLTIGGGSKFIPLTGVTLPLISYGGSSILTTLIMFAIVEGLYMIGQDEKEQARKRKKKAKKRTRELEIIEDVENL